MSISGNLSRCGCTQNLELLNAVSFDWSDEAKAHRLVIARSALRLFSAAANEVVGEAGAIADEWIADIEAQLRCLAVEEAPVEGIGNLPLNLFHTYDGSLWGRVEASWAADPPRRVLVISPFYDLNAEMLRRLHDSFPKCKVEVVAQQGTSNLPVRLIQKLNWKPSLFEICNSSRRLHGKLIAWETGKEVSCLVGSANFTVAGLDGANAEACFYLHDVAASIEGLFDSSLAKRAIAAADFTPGADQEPTQTADDEPVLWIDSAVLCDGQRLRAKYRCRLSSPPNSLAINIRCAGELHPRASKAVSPKGEAEITLPSKAMADVRGSLLASLAAKTSDSKLESTPVWVIQEDRLTHEPSDGSGGGKESKIRDSGEGLPEYLDELHDRAGVAAMVEYLNHLNIRFFDGEGRLGLGRRFRLRRSDPFHPDVSPEWWDKKINGAAELEPAIYDFAERHEQTRLRKHAQRGNINGMDNFLDIFTTIVRLMYVYSIRNVVKKPRLIGQVLRCIQVATSGIDTRQDQSDGYLEQLARNLRGDLDLLRKRCEEVNFVGHVRAALLIAQVARFVPDEKPLYERPATRPVECLRDRMETMEESFCKAGLNKPSNEKVVEAIKQYRMMSDKQLKQYEQDLA